MTISSLERLRPYFPTDLRCRITEMVTVGVVRGTKVSRSPLEEYLPQILYVTEAISLFHKANVKSKQLAVVEDTVIDSLNYVRSFRQLADWTKDPEMRVAVEKLNLLRTDFSDQFYSQGPLNEEYSSAVKTLFLDLPEVIEASTELASIISHPILDPSLETIDRVFDAVGKIPGKKFHREFSYRCHRFNLLREDAALIPTDNNTEVTTPLAELNWFGSQGTYNPLSEFSEYITPSLEAAVAQLVDQYYSLIYVKVRDDEAKRLIRDAGPVLRRGWDRLVEQCRLLLFLTNTHVSLQEGSLNVNWNHLFFQLEGADTLLEVAVLSKLKNLYKESVK